MVRLSLSVPATLANLGPGYDVLGMAVGVRNEFRFEPSETWRANGQQVEPGQHLTLDTARAAARDFGGVLPPLQVTQDEDVPRSRGMGSSATARVAGLAAAIALGDLEISLEDQLAWLSRQEGHPDNVVPARIGGVTLCRWSDAETLDWHRLPPPDLFVGLLVPDHEVETRAARELLPAQVSHRDAVHNVGATALLVAGLSTGAAHLISAGLTDRLHQPYRATLVGPLEDADRAARDAGAFGAFLSGSGSTVATLGPDAETTQRATDAMSAAFHQAGVPHSCRLAKPAGEGLRM